MSRQAKHYAHRGIIALMSCDKASRILATLKQGNKRMYRNTSEYVHMGLRLD